METFEIIVSFILLLVVITDTTAAYLLTRGAVRSKYSLVALNERAFVALTHAASATILALLGLNRILGWHWPTEVALTTLSAALLIQALPGFVWVTLYLLGKFNPDIKSQGEDE